MRNHALTLAFMGAVALAAGCDRVEYIEITPSPVICKQKNNDVWMRARAMSQTGIHYAHATIGWTIADPTVASIDDTGKLRPLKSGQTELTAAHKNIRATVPVEVLFAEKLVVQPTSLGFKEGDPAVELAVKVFDYKGRELTDRSPIFRSTDPEVVSMGQNAVFPVNAGQAKVEVRVGDLLQTVDVKVEGAKTATK